MKEKKQMYYRPLPENLRLGFSKIHDLGVFAKKKIERGTNLGMSHAKIGSRIIRTPLGGFINHADVPNCYKTKLFFTDEDNAKIKMNYSVWNLVALDNIKEEEELTVTYTFYQLDEKK